MSQIEVVYRGHDNVVQLTLSAYDATTDRIVPLDFSAVTRMVLVFPTTVPVIAFDSAVTAGVIEWDGAPGVVTLNIQAYALPVGVYPTQLIAYDPAHTNGLVLVDEALRPAEIEVREVFSSGLLPPPLPTGGSGVVRTAGETLSALKAVYELNGEVFALDPGTADAPVDLFLGITVSSALAGAEVVIQRDGTLDDASWSWSTGVVYVGAAGALTQVAPTAGWELVVGASPSPQRINLDFDEPVLLA